MQRTFVFHSDPGHGWLEVPRWLVNSLGIAGKISDYSYQSQQGRGPDVVYLEEDSDAGLFLEAFKAAHGEPVSFQERNEEHNDSFVRGLQRYRAAFAMKAA